MNSHRRPSCEHLDHHERNGTYMRVLIALPAEEVPSAIEPQQDGVAINTSRIVMLTASTLHALYEHTARLQTAAAAVDWELRPAHGLHRRIIERVQKQTTEDDAR